MHTFGGIVEKPKLLEKRQHRPPEVQDHLMPSVVPGVFAHYGSTPNTNYSTRMLHYKQRSNAIYGQSIQKQKFELARAGYMQQFDAHAESRRFHRALNARVNEKMDQYDHDLDEKRERMRKLIADDEREFYHETVDTLQKGKELKLDDIREKISKMKADREAERLKVVEEKRIQQYADRCEDLRPVMAKKHLLESKVIQLQQIRENEARRQADKELEAMWYHATMKELEARMEREKQEAIGIHQRWLDQIQTLETQIKGKQQAKEEEQRTKEEDRLELERLAEEAKRQQMEAAKSERQKRAKLATELQEQIKFQRKLADERNKAEQDLESAYNYLSNAQYEKEKMAIVDSRSQAHREIKQYLDYLKELEKKKKIDEAKHEQLLEEYRILIEKKQDDARCKIIEAKRKLLDDTVKGVAEQREYKLKLAQQELREKEAGNELLRLNYETNKQLMEEYKRNQACSRQKYKEDLEKQVEYNRLLKERENAELERMLEIGKKQEEEYKQKVQEIIDKSFEYGEKHPFRRVLEQYDCKCPETTTLQPKY